MITLEDIFERLHSLKPFKYEHNGSLLRRAIPDLVPSAIIAGLRHCKHTSNFSIFLQK
jgi:hypothetical protein